MQLRPKPHHYVQWLGASLAAALTTVGLGLAHAHPATAGMVFLVVVVVTATQAGLVISLYSAVLCAIAFDYFFLPPFHTFILAGPQEWVSMVTFAISSLVAGRVAERARQQKDEAEQRREDVERLFQISQEMILHQDAASLIRDLPHLLKRIFGLDTVALYVQDRDEFAASGDDLPQLFKSNLRDLGSGEHNTGADQKGFESHVLLVGLRPVGALAWSPPNLSREVATAVTAQIGIALTRAMAIEESARLEASRESERLRTALIDSLTHELRTPLTAIRAAATTLTQDQGLDDSLRKELATVVDEESARLDALIGEAVEMAEIDANVVRVQPSPRHTRTLLEQVVAESRASLGRHQAVLMVQEPDRPVWFDARLLGRVFRHLIENAARYSPPDARNRPADASSRRPPGVRGRRQWSGYRQNRLAAYLREVLSRQEERNSREGHRHGAGNRPCHCARTWRRPQRRERPGTWQHVSILGTAGGEGPYGIIWLRTFISECAF